MDAVTLLLRDAKQLDSRLKSSLKMKLHGDTLDRIIEYRNRITGRMNQIIAQSE